MQASLINRGKNFTRRVGAGKAAHQLGAGEVTQAEHADQFVLGKAFPGPAVSPGKAGGFDGGGREASR